MMVWGVRLAIGQEVEPAPLTLRPSLSTTTATTAATPTLSDPPPVGASADVTLTHSGLVEYVARRFTPNEQNYFLAGFDRPNAKFQVSIKYQMFNEEGTWAAKHPWITGFYAAYSQTSLWDIGGDSSPFFDSDYRPEMFWRTLNLSEGKWPGGATVDLQVGFDHESNGRGGNDSRTINHLYVQPMITFGDRKGLFFTAAPRLFTYLGDFNDTPDIEQYRGYGDLKFVFGQANGLQALILGRMSNDFERGSVQVDVSYPLRRLLNNNVDLYLHAQLFNGFGETLLTYRNSDTSFRLGFSLVR